MRDDKTGDVWSPTALPIRDASGVYVARHGRGYSRFEHTAHGVAANLLQYVPVEGSIKISRLRLTNKSNLTRHLSVTAFVEWVLGASRSATLAFVETETDATTGAIFARNPANSAFGSRVAFADMRGAQSDWTGDRREFIGRNRTLANPAALASASPLSNKVGAALDPCAAMRSQAGVAARERGRSRLLSGRGRNARGRPRRDPGLSRRRSRRLGSRHRAQLGRDFERDRGQDSRPCDGPHAQRLAALPDARLPHLGALGLLSSQRRLWLSRSIAGRHGACRRPARSDARTPPARGRPPVRRGRRAALVAAAFRSRRPDPNIRRSCLAGLYGRSICRDDARHARARRIDSFSRGRATRSGRNGSFF